MTNRILAANLADLAEQYAELSRWLENCPVVRNSDADAFHAVADTAFEAMVEKMAPLVEQMKSEPLTESFEAATQNGEYGELDEPVFWQMFAQTARNTI